MYRVYRAAILMNVRIVIGLLFILSCILLNSGSANKDQSDVSDTRNQSILFLFGSVHFKIHVPEIFKHQIHTKTVFIHVHKPTVAKKTKPKTEAAKTYKESHHEDWSSWNTYDYHNDHDDQTDDHRVMPENPKDLANNEIHNDKHHKKTNLHHHRHSYLPAMQHEDKPNYLKTQHGDMMNYSYPQYAVKEDVKEMDRNKIGPYMHMYKEGYHRGSESADGRIYSNDLTKFYENKHEEGDHSAEEYESREKTHTGRYFVDDPAQ
ncbi:PREDICTED: uncharacterized protein LOC106742055 [Dinoponera quadriceps]|uniref:Uncharacterized protein LOC106742055 n=1 Tax=Dinoponera quadriceps TaxID=609295 RepID=A0A6P3WVM1_DINQU|nr:PREDICTED: uncharacterized protein LOC106742055 [Dinoponera quadriceps]